MNREYLSLEEVHQLLLNGAKAIHHVLTRHNIPYYMLGGTMLGSVRHQGFIPWDDDMDLGIPRPYFKQALEVLGRELPPRYAVRDVFNCKPILTGIVKVEDTTTQIDEFEKYYPGYPLGVYVDLFPLDCGVSRSPKHWKHRLLHVIKRVNKARFMPDSSITHKLQPVLRVLMAWADRTFGFRVMMKLISNGGG